MNRCRHVRMPHPPGRSLRDRPSEWARDSLILSGVDSLLSSIAGEYGRMWPDTRTGPPVFFASIPNLHRVLQN